MKNLFYIYAVILISFIGTSCTNNLTVQSSQTLETEEDDYYKEWSDEIICYKAWDKYDGQLTDDPDLIQFVQIVKERNLDCNPDNFVKENESIIKVKDDNFLFPIEGINIGNDVDLHFTPSEIVRNMTNNYSHLSDKFLHVRFDGHYSFKMYDTVEIVFNQNDMKIPFPIGGVVGFIYYDKDIQDCYKDKQKVVDRIKMSFKDAELEEPKVLTHPEDKTGKSKYEVNKINLEDGFARVTCYDMSEEVKITDALVVEITSNEVNDWLSQKKIN